MKKKILIVDDHGHIRFMISNRLKNLGFSTVSAESANDIIKQVLMEKPHLILMDKMLPGIDGIEASRLLKQHPETKNIPIIMLTALSMKSNVMESLKSGVDDYVIKPFKADELFKKIVNLIGEPEKDSAEDKKKS
jgi:two-component system phosphate regulon response regulator PhoB